MTLTDALKDDLRRMEDIAIEAGFRANAVPYEKDADKTDRFFWALAVAVLHLLQAEIRRREKEAKDAKTL